MSISVQYRHLMTLGNFGFMKVFNFRIGIIAGNGATATMFGSAKNLSIRVLVLLFNFGLYCFFIFVHLTNFLNAHSISGHVNITKNCNFGFYEYLFSREIFLEKVSIVSHGQLCRAHALCRLRSVYSPGLLRALFTSNQ
jgi:hypothetical protein